MEQTQQRVWDKETIQRFISVRDDALAQAVLTIYARQTADEQAAKETIVRNGRGFTGTDASFLSDIAKKLPHYGNRMTPRQIAKVRPKMRKYWRQLLEEIEAKGGKVNYKVAKSPKNEIAKEREPERATPRNIEVAQPVGFGAW